MKNQKSQKLENILQTIISFPELHGCWLETLSHLENRGAHKIINHQPAQHADLFLLQHAAEESRHAFFFKNQIKRLPESAQGKKGFIGGRFSRRYLDLLDLSIAKLLKSEFLSKRELEESCYYLTSYTIEVRAKDLYESYEKVLKEKNSPFSLRSLLREEEHHLKEMEDAIKVNSFLEKHRDSCLRLEENLYNRLLNSLERDLSHWEEKLCA